MSAGHSLGRQAQGARRQRLCRRHGSRFRDDERTRFPLELPVGQRAPGERARLLDEDKYYDPATFSTRVIRGGTRILFLAEDSQHGPDLWSAAPDFHDPPSWPAPP